MPADSIFKYKAIRQLEESHVALPVPRFLPKSGPRILEAAFGASFEGAAFWGIRRDTMRRDLPARSDQAFLEGLVVRLPQEQLLAKPSLLLHVPRSE